MPTDKNMKKMSLEYRIFIFFDSKNRINKFNINDNVAIFFICVVSKRISSWFLNYSANFKRYFILSAGKLLKAKIKRKNGK